MQYKEQELDKLVKEKITVEEKLKNSNTEKLHNEILELNIANSRVRKLKHFIYFPPIVVFTIRPFRLEE